GSFQKDEGVMNYSQNDRMNVRAKINGNLSKKVKFSINVSPSYDGNTRPATNFTNYFRFPTFLLPYHNEFTSQFVHQNAQWADILPGDYAQARHFNGLTYAGTLPDGSFWESSGVVDPFGSQNNTPLSEAARENINRKRY